MDKLGNRAAPSLHDVEAHIDRAVFATTDPKPHSFHETVRAVSDIVTFKLYKAEPVEKRDASVESYFKSKWNISRAQVYRLLDCHMVLTALQKFPTVPVHERQCRILKKLTKGDANALMNLWQKVLESHPDVDASQLTSSIIEYVYEECFGEASPKKKSKPRKDILDDAKPKELKRRHTVAAISSGPYAERPPPMPRSSSFSKKKSMAIVENARFETEQFQGSFPVQSFTPAFAQPFPLVYQPFPAFVAPLYGEYSYETSFSQPRPIFPDQLSTTLNGMDTASIETRLDTRADVSEAGQSTIRTLSTIMDVFQDSPTFLPISVVPPVPDRPLALSPAFRVSTASPGMPLPEWDHVIGGPEWSS
jgi:hypothetical protein